MPGTGRPGRVTSGRCWWGNGWLSRRGGLALSKQRKAKVFDRLGEVNQLENLPGE
jgi:hypothetical protein